MAEQIKKLKGFATPEGTARFRDRKTDIHPSHYVTAQDLQVSDLGLGTYLGELDRLTDQRYTDAVRFAMQRGINVIDTAINYRCQRSERCIGDALASLIATGEISRDEIIVATKGGFVSYDGEPTTDYLQSTFFDHGLIEPKDVVAGCHCMHPAYLRHELSTSLDNLGLETIDIYHLHNVETQLLEVDRSTFEDRLLQAFRFLEEMVHDGKIVRYGLATWDCFRVALNAPNHLSVERVLELAREAGGDAHHFQVVQLPFNLAVREAAVAPTQMDKGEPVPFLEIARRKNLTVMGSVPLFQGRLLGRLPETLQNQFLCHRTDSERAIAFAAATPGITTTLTGMSRRQHVQQNTGYLRRDRLEKTAWRSIVDNLT